jgi:hypothetical protein
MDLNFNKVTYDGDLADFDADELRELVGEFENAQESNVAEFETAAEALDGVDEAGIEEFADARGSLIESITDADAFSEVPLSEDALDNCTFGELQDWQDFVSESVDADEDDDSEQEFDDMGSEAPTHGDDDADAEFAEKYLDISGVNFD